MTTPSKNPAIAIIERLIEGGRCKFDMLNPCFDNCPSDVPGKHADGTDACAYCTARAFLAYPEAFLIDPSDTTATIADAQGIMAPEPESNEMNEANWRFLEALPEGQFRTMASRARIKHALHAAIDYAMKVSRQHNEDEWFRCDDRLPEIDHSQPVHSWSVRCLVESPKGDVMEATWTANGHAKTEKGRAPRWERFGRRLHFDPVSWRHMPLPASSKEGV